MPSVHSERHTGSVLDDQKMDRQLTLARNAEQHCGRWPNRFNAVGLINSRSRLRSTSIHRPFVISTLSAARRVCVRVSVGGCVCERGSVCSSCVCVRACVGRACVNVNVCVARPNKRATLQFTPFVMQACVGHNPIIISSP